VAELVWTEYTRFLIALNPLAAIPISLSLTEGYSPMCLDGLVGRHRKVSPAKRVQLLE
jgi:hypothetical protein